MSTDSKTTPVIKREEFTYPATEKGTLVLSVGLQRQIEWLHKMVGAKEWCGVLFYKRLEGDIDNPKDLKLYASEIYLMDIGRETYTEADFDGNAAVEMWDMVNDDYTFKRGLIHTHHNMTTFFSGTDMSELHDNVGTHNYYLSLIVNFSGVYTAKVAFTAKRRIQMEYKNVTDENKEFVTEKDLLMMIDMNIVKEQEEVAVPDFFRTRFTSLKAQIEERATAQSRSYTTAASTNGGNGTSSHASQSEDDDDWYGLYGPDPNFASAGGRGSVPAPAKSSTTVTPEGNLQRGSKELRPAAKVEADIVATCLQWLNDATHICSDMDKRTFGSITTAVEFFRDYFDEPCHDAAQQRWFLNQVQRDMETRFKRWFPTLVQRIGMEILDVPMIGNPLAGELYDMFESYPQYIKEMAHVNANIKKQEKGTPNTKQRQHVHARRKSK